MEGRPPIRVQLLKPGDPAWDEQLEATPRDVYHTAGFHAYAEGSGEGEAGLLVAGDRDRWLAWPYLLRPVAQVDGLEDASAADVTSVYGYSGPLASGCVPGDEFLADAWREIAGVWREQGVVSAFTRFHPLLENAALIGRIPWGDSRADEPAPVAPLGRTISIDLTLADAAIRSGYSESLRRQIKNYRQVGQVTTHDESWDDLEAFTSLYHETMSRNEADEYYFWDVENFRRLRASLDGHVHLLVTRVGDVVGAAGLFTEYQGIVQEHLMAANEALASVSPYKVLIDDTAHWAKLRGNSVLHLGGGRGAREDSLFEFKRRFSPRRHEFFTGRWILDRARYDELVEARSAAVGPGKTLSPGYFPRYRAQAVDAQGPDEA